MATGKNPESTTRAEKAVVFLAVVLVGTIGVFVWSPFPGGQSDRESPGKDIRFGTAEHGALVMDADWVGDPKKVEEALRQKYGSNYEQYEREGVVVDATMMDGGVRDQIGDEWLLGLPGGSSGPAGLVGFLHRSLVGVEVINETPFAILGGAPVWQFNYLSHIAENVFVAFRKSRFPRVRSLPLDLLEVGELKMRAIRVFLEREWGGPLGQIAEGPTFWNFSLIKVGFRKASREVLIASCCKNEWCNDGITGAWVIRRWEPTLDAEEVRSRLMSGEGEDFHRASRVWLQNALEVDSVGNVLVLGLGYYEGSSLVLVKEAEQGNWSEWLVSPYWGL